MQSVLSADQLRSLGSPACQQVFSALRALKPASAREVAKQIGKSPATAAYHLTELTRVGLVREAGKRPSGRRPETLYEPTADRLSLPKPGTDPLVSSLTRKAVLAGLRHAMHGYERAAEKGLGETGLIHIIRASVRLSPEDANRFIDLIAEANRFAAERQAAGGVLIQWSSLVYPEDLSAPSEVD